MLELSLFFLHSPLRILYYHCHRCYKEILFVFILIREPLVSNSS